MSPAISPSGKAEATSGSIMVASSGEASEGGSPASTASSAGEAASSAGEAASTASSVGEPASTTSSDEGRSDPAGASSGLGRSCGAAASAGGRSGVASRSGVGGSPLHAAVAAAPVTTRNRRREISIAADGIASRDPSGRGGPEPVVLWRPDPGVLPSRPSWVGRRVTSRGYNRARPSRFARGVTPCRASSPRASSAP